MRLKFLLGNFKERMLNSPEFIKSNKQKEKFHLKIQMRRWKIIHLILNYFIINPIYLMIFI